MTTEPSRRDFMKLLAAGTGAAAGIGAFGLESNQGTKLEPALANQVDVRPTPWNVVGNPMSNNQQSWKPSTRTGNATVAEGGYAMDIPGFNYHIFGAEGCGQFAAYAMGIKSGYLSKDIGIDAYVDGAIKAGNLRDPNWYNYAGHATGMGITDFKQIRGGLAEVKQGYDDGYIPIVYLNLYEAGFGYQHFVMIDYIEGDKIYIVDSEGLGDTLQWYTNKGISLAQIDLYRGKKPANELPRISNGTEGIQEQKELINLTRDGVGLLKEEDLTGMQSWKEVKGLSERMWESANVEVTKQMTIDSLSIGEQNQIANLDESINSGKKSFSDYANIGVSVLGFAGMFYSMFLFFAYIFDRTNNFVDIKLLNKITAGKMEVVHDKEDVRNEGGVRYVDAWGIVKWASLALVISLLLVSGWAVNTISWLILKIQGVF